MAQTCIIGQLFSSIGRLLHHNYSKSSEDDYAVDGDWVEMKNDYTQIVRKNDFIIIMTSHLF